MARAPYEFDLEVIFLGEVFVEVEPSRFECIDGFIPCDRGRFAVWQNLGEPFFDFVRCERFFGFECAAHQFASVGVESLHELIGALM